MRRVAIALLLLALAPAAAQAHQAPAQDSCAPPRNPPSGEASRSDNVRYLGSLVGEAADMAAGGRLVGRYFYMTGASHFSIYDTIDPARPQLVSRVDFPCRFENEDVATDGRVLIYSDFAITRMLHVYDVRDPRQPKLLAEVPDAGRHTMQCVLDCRYLYGSYKADNPDAPVGGGLVVDLADPANPQVLGDWTADEILPSRKVHDVNEVAPGIVVAAAAPIQVMDVRENPLAPKVLGRSPDPEKRYHSVEWPRGGKDRWMMAMFETNATPRCEAGAGDFTVFDARGVGTTGRIEPVSSYFLQNANDESSQGNPDANLNLGCSPHWFQVRPSWHDGGVLAMAAYDHGVKFLRVDGEGKISEVGHFRAPGTNAAAAYWVTCDIVYVVDYTRGLDVIRFKDPASDCAQEAAPAPPRAAACTGRTAPVLRVGWVTRSRRRISVTGRARPGECGGRIVRVEILKGRRVLARARGTTRWRVSLRARQGLRVRAMDAFGNATTRRLP